MFFGCLVLKLDMNLTHLKNKNYLILKFQINES